jgi:hypothetical protein
MDLASRPLAPTMVTMSECCPWPWTLDLALAA